MYHENPPVEDSNQSDSIPVSSHFIVYVWGLSTPVKFVLISPPPLPLAQQKHAESFPKGLVAECVTHGVDGAVDVAQPVAQVPQRRGDALHAERGDEHHDVVRRPGEDESQQDGAEGLSRFLLLHQYIPLPFGHLVLQDTVRGFGSGERGRRGAFGVWLFFRWRRFQDCQITVLIL